MNYRIQKRRFDKKKPPEANSSTQKLQKVKRKRQEANASTQKSQTNIKKCQRNNKKSKKGLFVTALTMVSIVNKVTILVSLSFLVLFEFCLTSV